MYTEVHLAVKGTRSQLRTTRGFGRSTWVITLTERSWHVRLLLHCVRQTDWNVR